MRLLIQRVVKASVSVNNKIISSIDKGLLLFIGIENDDNIDDIVFLANKTINLRIFDDYKGVMNCSVSDISGSILVVSQFTLFASTKKGNRPSYLRSAKSEISYPIYNKFCEYLSSIFPGDIKTGEFGGDMKIDLINDGPITIWIDSKNKE